MLAGKVGDVLLLNEEEVLLNCECTKDNDCEMGIDMVLSMTEIIYLCIFGYTFRKKSPREIISNSVRYLEL